MNFKSSNNSSFIVLISCRNLSYKTQKINNDIMGINIAKMKIERENLQHADDVTLVLKDKAIEAVKISL